jgi:GrpB-like predicted nucleotidyltransferase (UPF0157 family)
MILGSRGTSGASQIQVVDYEPSWPEAFHAEAMRVVSAVGDLIGQIEHIGSTSVPGLDAKPMIDLMAEAVSPTPDPMLVPRLARIGYRHRPDEFTDRLLFSLGPLEASTHNLHIVGSGRLDTANEILFRDRLRADPEIAAQYAALKRELASRTWQRFAYSRAKTQFILAVVDEERCALGMDPVDIWSTLGPRRREAWIRSGDPVPHPRAKALPSDLGTSQQRPQILCRVIGHRRAEWS